MIEINYSQKPKISDFSYYFVINKANKFSSFVYKELIAPAIKEVKSDYGIDFNEIAYGDLPEDDNHTYVIYGPTDPLNLGKEETAYLKRLASVSEIKVNVISAYSLENGSDTDFYKENSKNVPNISRKLGVNFIFPDNIVSGHEVRTTDSDDIKDNIICETIRLKYEPIKDSKIDFDILGQIQEKNKENVEQIRNLHEKFSLWHRDKTDGALMVRTDNGWLVSQTKTDKTKITVLNFSLVTDFSSENNNLSYLGSKIPSSDAPDFLIFAKLLYKDNVKPKYFVHFHKNQITRDESFKNYLTKRKIEYGKFTSGFDIYEEYKKIRKNWLILLEHGPLWWGDSVDDFKSFLTEILKLKET